MRLLSPKRYMPLGLLAQVVRADVLIAYGMLMAKACMCFSDRNSTHWNRGAYEACYSHFACVWVFD